MQHKNIITIVFWSFLCLGGIQSGFVYANETTDTPTTQDIIDDQLNTSYPANLISQDPQTQEQANILIDQYVEQNLSNIYYTDSSSLGELKILIKDPSITTKQQIDFVLVKYLVDTGFQFDGSQYLWTVMKGDKELFRIQEQDKSSFFYTFPETGVYTVNLTVLDGEVRKSGSFTFNVTNTISLDYRPLNPVKGDKITVVSPLPVSQYTVEWKLDRKSIPEAKGQNFVFTENKGYGSNYKVELILKDRVSDIPLYRGTATILIESPEIRINLTNQDTNSPIDYAEEISVDTEQKLLLAAEVSNFQSDAKVEYTYRVNDEVQNSIGNTLELTVNPQLSYKVYIIAKSDTGEELTTKQFMINPGKPNVLEANITSAKWWNIDERHWGMIILLSIGMLAVWGTQFSYKQS